MKTLNLKYFGVTILIFRNHVTSSVMWPLDSAHVVFYWWSIETKRLSCTVTEIWSLKVAFAHVKGQKFTAHASCHVTCRQGGSKWPHIWNSQVHILPIHYTTSMRLRWRLRAVCRWKFNTHACFSRPKRWLRTPRVTWPKYWPKTIDSSRQRCLHATTHRRSRHNFCYRLKLCVNVKTKCCYWTKLNWVLQFQWHIVWIVLEYLVIMLLHKFTTECATTNF